MAAIREPFSSSADWTSTVEGAVRGELERRRRWLRAYMALLVALMAATLVLMVMGVTEVAELRRQVEPTVEATQRLDVSTAALSRGQTTLDARLSQAEATLAELKADRSAAPAPAAAPAAPTTAPTPAVQAAPPRRRGPSKLERAVAGLDQRLQRVEAAASAAEIERSYLTGQMLRLDATVTRLGAALGPQSAP